MMLSTLQDQGAAPTALPPPPRRVRGHVGCGEVFARIFFVPFTLIGIIGIALFAREWPRVLRGDFAAVFWWVTVGVWNLFAVIVLHGLWVLPLRHRRLLAFGVPTPGRVIARRAFRGFSVKYAYRGPAGEELSGWMPTSRRAWKQTETMGTVTVLYSPDEPKKSVVYELSWYRVEP